MKKIVIRLHQECIEIVESNHPDYPIKHSIGRTSSVLQELLDLWSEEGYKVEILPVDEKRKKLENEVDMFIKSHKNLDEFKEILKEVSSKYFEEMSHKDDATPYIKWHHIGSSKPIFEKISEDTYKLSNEGLRTAVAMLFSQTNFDEKKVIAKINTGRFHKEIGAIITLKNVDAVSESKSDIWKRVNDKILEVSMVSSMYRPDILGLNKEDYEELRSRFSMTELITVVVQGYTLTIRRVEGKSYLGSEKAELLSHKDLNVYI